MMSVPFGMYCTVGLLLRGLAVGATDAVASLDYCAAEGTAPGGRSMAGALFPPRRGASDSYAVETIGVSLVQRLLARSSFLPTDSDEDGPEMLLDQSGTTADAPGARDRVGLPAASSPAAADTAGLERAAASSPNLTSKLGLLERFSGVRESLWARGLQRIRWPDAQWLLAVEQEASCFLPIGLVLSGLVGALAFVVCLFARVNGDGDDSQLPFAPRSSASLCKALVVPDGSECTLAVPSLQQEVPEGRLDLDVCDQTGRPFLRVALECTSLSAEYITLKSLDGSTYATCRVSIGNTQSARLCGFIYRPGSELFARLTEPPDMVGVVPAWETAGGPVEGAAEGTLGVATGVPAFSLWSVKAGEWGMHFHGDVTDRQVCITDKKMKLVAAALPGDGSLDRLQDHYLLRIEPGGDTGLLLCSLFVIDRILATRSKKREA